MILLAGNQRCKVTKVSIFKQPTQADFVGNEHFLSNYIFGYFLLLLD